MLRGDLNPIALLNRKIEVLISFGITLPGNIITHMEYSERPDIQFAILLNYMYSRLRTLKANGPMLAEAESKVRPLPYYPHSKTNRGTCPGVGL